MHANDKANAFAALMDGAKRARVEEKEAEPTQTHEVFTLEMGAEQQLACKWEVLCNREQEGDADAAVWAWEGEVTLKNMFGKKNPGARRSVRLTLRTNVASAAVEPPTSQPSSMSLKVSMAKSMLQKAVRRQGAGAGGAAGVVRLTNWLLDENPTEILRRAAVIMLEDSILHPVAAPILVWLMMADSAGYILGPELRVHVLLFMAQLATVSVHDMPPAEAAEFPSDTTRQADGDDTAGADEPTLLQLWDSMVASPLSSPVSSSSSSSPPSSTTTAVVKSLLARRAFGGMKWDMQLLEACFREWSGRLLHPDCDVWWAYLTRVFTDTHISMQDVHQALRVPVGRGDLCRAGVDFHVSNVFDQAVLGSPAVMSSVHTVGLPHCRWLHTQLRLALLSDRRDIESSEDSHPMQGRLTAATRQVQALARNIPSADEVHAVLVGALDSTADFATGQDVRGLLSTTMWYHSSSCNPRDLLPLAEGAPAPVAGSAQARVRAWSERIRVAIHRAVSLPLWLQCSSSIEAYMAAYVSRSFS